MSREVAPDDAVVAAAYQEAVQGHSDAGPDEGAAEEEPLLQAESPRDLA